MQSGSRWMWKEESTGLTDVLGREVQDNPVDLGMSCWKRRVAID